MLFNPSASNPQSAADGFAGNARHCAQCGKSLRPKKASRRQRFCDSRCRDKARRERNFAAVAATRRRTPHPSAAIPRSVENPPLTSTACKGDFADRAYSISGPRVAVETEIVAGRGWQPVTSPDGVTCEVTRVRADSDSIADMPSDWQPTWSSTWRTQIDAPIPDFLKREIPAAPRPAATEEANPAPGAGLDSCGCEKETANVA